MWKEQIQTLKGFILVLLMVSQQDKLLVLDNHRSAVWSGCGTWAEPPIQCLHALAYIIAFMVAVLGSAAIYHQSSIDGLLQG